MNSSYTWICQVSFWGTENIGEFSLFVLLFEAQYPWIDTILFVINYHEEYELTADTVSLSHLYTLCYPAHWWLQPMVTMLYGWQNWPLVSVSTRWLDIHVLHGVLPFIQSPMISWPLDVSVEKFVYGIWGWVQTFSIRGKYSLSVLTAKRVRVWDFSYSWSCFAGGRRFKSRPWHYSGSFSSNPWICHLL